MCIFYVKTSLAGLLNEVSSKSVTTILKWPVANIQWSPPSSDYSKSMCHDRSEMVGDNFFNSLNLNLVFKFLIKILKKNERTDAIKALALENAGKYCPDA